MKRCSRGSCVVLLLLGLSMLSTLSLYLHSLSSLSGYQLEMQTEKMYQISSLPRALQVVDVHNAVATASVFPKKNDEMNVASAKQKVVDVPVATAARSALTKRNDEMNITSAKTLFRTEESNISSSRMISQTTTDAAKATIVVFLTGHFGNYISGIAHAKGLQLSLLKEYGIGADLALFHDQNPRVWKRVRRELQLCFPNLRPLDFAKANGPEYQERARQQNEWLGTQQRRRLSSINQAINPPYALVGVINETNVMAGLQHYHELLTDPTRPNIPANANLAVPFLFSTTFSSSFVVDKFYDEIRNFLQFDDSCCGQVPDPDESVFHFRNFHRVVVGHGFDEPSPNKTAYELFGHLKAGDKIAMTTFKLDNVALEYVEVFKKRGLQVRVISGQSRMQGFCFLKKAQKEVVGSAVSTFFRWAAFLGDAKRAQLYILDNRKMRSIDTKKPLLADLKQFKWSNPILESRVQFRFLMTEEVEEIERDRSKTALL